MTENIDRDFFADLADKYFYLPQQDGSEIKLELLEVSELKSMERHEEFSLVFLAPPNVTIDPLTYTLKHKVMGELTVFLSPFWSDEKGLKLEAAFSILI